MNLAAILGAALGSAALFVLFAVLPRRRNCSSDCGSCTTACSRRQGQPR